MLDLDGGELERRLDRDYGHEPSLNRRRAPVLDERGTVRVYFDRFVAVEPEIAWRPSDENGGRS